MQGKPFAACREIHRTKEQDLGRPEILCSKNLISQSTILSWEIGTPIPACSDSRWAVGDGAQQSRGCVSEMPPCIGPVQRRASEQLEMHDRIPSVSPSPTRLV